MKLRSFFLKTVLCVVLIVGISLFTSCDYIRSALEQMESADFPWMNDSNHEGENGDDPEKVDDTAYLTTVEEYISIKNQGKSRVVMDLSSLSSTHIGKTVTIGDGITEVVFQGGAERSYTSMNVVVEANSSEPLTIVFKNLNVLGDSQNGTIYCSNGRNLIIRSDGSGNMISGGANAPAISASSSHIIFEGSAMMALNGGNGVNGQNGGIGNANYGSAGGIGCTAVIVSQITKQGSFTLALKGGSGGDGGNGSQGANGSHGGYGDGDIWVSQSKPVGTAGSGTSGFAGGNGGDGGEGGYPLNQGCSVAVFEGSLQMQVGNGGNGGNGGSGGNGGTGGTGGDADRGSWMFGAGWSYGSNGGKGGNGGDGGRGGNGGISDSKYLNYSVTVSPGAKYVLSSSMHGAGGNGGTGGKGGVGGIGGSCDSVVTGEGCGYYGQRCTCGGAGGSGGTGGNGGIGGNGSVAGVGGSGGQGGSGGRHSTSKYTCSCVGDGRNGSDGKIGSAGSVIAPTQNS